MTPERRRRQIIETFESALEYRPEDRAAFLDRACAGDPELRAEIDSLLPFADDAEDFLEAPALEVLDLTLDENARGAISEEINIADQIVGRRLGDFTVLEKLGEGGFSTVFRAEQKSASREAVVKVLSARHQADKQIVKRFKREARLASRLEHPYMTRIYGYGTEPDGLMWIAMEYVRGAPLNRHLKSKGPIPLESFVPLLDKICEVVQAAHELGIVHRDLKPGNVMVIANGAELSPMLLDFGIAKRIDEEISRFSMKIKRTSKEIDSDKLSESFRERPSKTTNENTVIGSPAYMSPEQWDGCATVDARADIYSLGVLSYEAITGSRPFQTVPYVYLSESDIPPLDDRFPPALNGVMKRVLAKRPEDRYGSAVEFSAAFRRACFGDVNDSSGSARRIKDNPVRRMLRSLRGLRD